MFISSYSTFVNANLNNKITKKEDSSSTNKAFEKHLQKNTFTNFNLQKNTPVNYISQYKTLSTKEKINDQLRQNVLQTNLKKLSTINAQTIAPSAYSANTKMFSLMIKYPNAPKQLENTQLKTLKEPMQRVNMVNTYLENDKYYQITA